MMRDQMRGYVMILLCVILISGCTFPIGGGGQGPKESSTDEDGKLKIAVWNERSFHQLYGNIFSKKYPKVELEIVTIDLASNSNDDVFVRWSQMIEEERPDVIVFPNPDLFEDYIYDGKLLDLGATGRLDGFNLEEIDAHVLDYLREIGNGGVYGLSPSFTSKVLYYNVDLFEENGVQMPYDGMEWEELLQLAALFPADGDESSRIYGYYHPGGGVFDLFSLMGRSRQLNMFDDDLSNITVNTPGWTGVWESLLDAYAKEYVYRDERENTSASNSGAELYLKNMFTAGRAAMMIHDASYIAQLQSAAQVTEIEMPNWEVVAIPSDPLLPMETSEFRLLDVMGVYANSVNEQLALNFIKYINSNEVARLIAQLDIGRMTIRREYSDERDGRRMDAFYMMKPMSIRTDRMPNALHSMISSLIEKELDAFIHGEKSAGEALESFEQQVQLKLNEFKED